MLAATRTTLNVQSFMGAIMAIGVAVANAILLVTFAEQARRSGGSPLHTAIDAARARMRPVLMTSAAMIAGMMPMALAIGEGAEADRAARARGHRRPRGRHARHADRAAVGVLARAAVGRDRVTVVGSGRSRRAPIGRREQHEHAHRTFVVRCGSAGALRCRSGSRACARQRPRPAQPETAAAAGPPTLEVVRVVEQPLNVTLSLPGELNAVPDGRDLPARDRIREDDAGRSRLARARRRR